jgi:hypothetical protein
MRQGAGVAGGRIQQIPIEIKRFPVGILVADAHAPRCWCGRRHNPADSDRNPTLSGRNPNESRRILSYKVNSAPYFIDLQFHVTCLPCIIAYS